ncbi:TPA: hypothetical protein RG672_000034 [Morganella morganii]|nr:hypothetical protein [Morganella morganii]
MIGKFTVNQKILTNNISLLSTNNINLRYSNVDKDDIDSKIFDAVNGVISAKKLTDNLFPEKEPHIFISHSSKDVNLAISLANTLYEKYNIISFIDSQLWGHIDYALKEMHKLHCAIPGSHHYSYEKSNNLLSHIHTILSMALMRVMDNADSVIFIESDNSIYHYMEDDKISPLDIIERTSETLSPWISSEVNFANKLRAKGHKDRIDKLIGGLESRSFNDEKMLAENAQLKIIHDLDLTNFIKITDENFKKSLSLKNKTPIENLDMIYGTYAQS